MRSLHLWLIVSLPGLASCAMLGERSTGAVGGSFYPLRKLPPHVQLSPQERNGRLPPFSASGLMPNLPMIVLRNVVSQNTHLGNFSHKSVRREDNVGILRRKSPPAQPKMPTKREDGAQLVRQFSVTVPRLVALLKWRERERRSKEEEIETRATGEQSPAAERRRYLRHFKEYAEAFGEDKAEGRGKQADVIAALNQSRESAGGPENAANRADYVVTEDLHGLKDLGRDEEENQSRNNTQPVTAIGEKTVEAFDISADAGVGHVNEYSQAAEAPQEGGNGCHQPPIHRRGAATAEGETAEGSVKYAKAERESSPEEAGGGFDTYKDADSSHVKEYSQEYSQTATSLREDVRSNQQSAEGRATATTLGRAAVCSAECAREGHEGGKVNGRESEALTEREREFQTIFQLGKTFKALLELPGVRIYILHPSNNEAKAGDKRAEQVGGSARTSSETKARVQVSTSTSTAAGGEHVRVYSGREEAQRGEEERYQRPTGFTEEQLEKREDYGKDVKELHRHEIEFKEVRLDTLANAVGEMAATTVHMVERSEREVTGRGPQAGQEVNTSHEINQSRTTSEVEGETQKAGDSGDSRGGDNGVGVNHGRDIDNLCEEDNKSENGGRLEGDGSGEGEKTTEIGREQTKQKEEGGSKVSRQATDRTTRRKGRRQCTKIETDLASLSPAPPPSPAASVNAKDEVSNVPPVLPPCTAPSCLVQQAKPAPATTVGPGPPSDPHRGRQRFMSVQLGIARAPYIEPAVLHRVPSVTVVRKDT